MKRKIIVVFFIFIFAINFIIVSSFALTNDIQNDKLRVLFNKKIDGMDVKVRTSEYENMIKLSDAELEEVTRDPVDIDYSGIDLFDYENRDFDYFDINAFVNGEWKSTTYGDFGYFTVLKVNNNEPKLIKYNKDVLFNIEKDVNCEFVYDGNFVRIEYSLKNIGNEDAVISLGCFADVQVALNDCAKIERIGDSVGIRMYDPEENLQYAFYGKNNEYVTDIDRLWLGLYPEEEVHFFNQNNINVIERNDTAYTFSWVNRTIAPGETKKYSVLIGMGKLTSVPIVEFDKEQEDYFEQSDIKINVDVRDSDEDSSAELHFVVDNSDIEEKIDFQKLVDGKLRIPIDLSERNLNIGKHHIKVWAIDNQGNLSNYIEKDFYITNIRAPIIDMSEEWTKEDAKFKITDTVNNPDKVSKYQYKIGDGDWTDTALDTETTALDKSGTVKIKARAVGKVEEEYAYAVEKEAKVDKDVPVDNKVIFSEKKFSFSGRDEHSGVKEFRYYWSEKSDFEDTELIKYEEPFEYISESKKDVYLHFVTRDNVNNDAISKATFPYPDKPSIESEKTYKDVVPSFKIRDSQQSGDFPFTYEMKINDGEWQKASVNQGYDVANVLEGKNYIRVRKSDVIGRISDEVVSEFTFEKTKEEPSPTPNPTPTPTPTPTQEDNTKQNSFTQPSVPTQTTQQTVPTTTTDSTQSYAVANNQKDETTANKKIPKAGNKNRNVLMKLLIGFCIVSIVASGIWLKKYKF